MCYERPQRFDKEMMQVDPVDLHSRLPQSFQIPPDTNVIVEVKKGQWTMFDNSEEFLKASAWECIKPFETSSKKTAMSTFISSIVEKGVSMSSILHRCVYIKTNKFPYFGILNSTFNHSSFEKEGPTPRNDQACYIVIEKYADISMNPDQYRDHFVNALLSEAKAVILMMI